MGKRQKITYDERELTRNLKQSAGRGVDAFFPDTAPTPARIEIETVDLPASHTTNMEIDARTHTRTHADVEAPSHAGVDAWADAPADEQMQPSTQSGTPAQAETSGDAGTDANVDTHMHARTGARMHARSDEDDRKINSAISERTEEVNIEAIQKAIRAKRHLSSFTFRFRANELEELDLVVDELNQDDEHRVSKNDAVRTALNWLLADYRARKHESVLARVLTDT